MKLMLLLAIMDVLIFCGYLVLFLKEGLKRMVGKR
jgi:hypothetical protein